MATLIRQTRIRGDAETRENRHKNQGSTKCSLWKAEWSHLSEHGEDTQTAEDKEEEEMIVTRPWMAATSVNFNQRCQGVIEGIAPGHGWNDMVRINSTYSVWRKAWGIHVQVNTVAWDLEWDKTGFELCNILASYLIPLRLQSPHQLPEGSNGAYISRVYMKMKWVNTYKKLKLFCYMESTLVNCFQNLVP